MDFVNAAHYDNGSSASAVVNKPTNTADNDIMFAIMKRLVSTDPTTVPTGWTLLGYADNGVTGGYYWLYWKLASSEGASYTWEWAAATRTGGTIVSYRGDFNTADPIDVVSNTVYITDSTACRAASMTVAAANSPLVFLGLIAKSASALTFTPPTTPADVWVEDVDTWDLDSRFGREICHMAWTGSGATGNMDATLSATFIDKHAFAVALNPAAGGGAVPMGAISYYLRMMGSQ